MKIPVLFTLLFASFCIRATAQCIFAVPPTAVVVSTTQTINGGFDPIWVCSNDTLHSDGGFHNIFLEPGSVMTTGGGIDTIYVKDGASLFMYGGIDIIYYITPTDVVLGGIPDTILCSSMTFDYTNAPVNGCNIAPVAAFQSSDSTLCDSTCISFYSLSTDAVSWQWTFAGGNPPTSTDENPLTICYDTSGNFDVTLIVINGNGSDTLTLNNFITVYPEPLISVLAQSGDTISASQGFVSYQWYFEGNLINGATDYFYVTTQNGNYSVVVTDGNGCQASASINATGTGINSISAGTSDNQINIFPNPATSTIIITDINEETLQFFDLSGRNIYAVKTSSSGKTEVNISAFPTLFFVRAENGEIKKCSRY